MADDLNSAIKQIAQMLGMTGQGSAASGTQGSQTSGAQGSASPSAEPDPPALNYQPQMAPGAMGNVDIIAKARDMLDSFNNVSDHRINLLHSIHPFLSPARQSSCASCIQLLKIISVIGTISPGNRSSGPKG